MFQSSNIKRSLAAINLQCLISSRWYTVICLSISHCDLPTCITVYLLPLVCKSGYTYYTIMVCYQCCPKIPALTSSRAHQYWGRGESQACSADWPKIIRLLASHPQNKDRPGDGHDLHHVPDAQAFRGSKTELQSMSRFLSI